MGDIFRLPICLAGAGFIWARGSLLFFMNKSVTDNAFSSLLDFTQMCSVVAVSIAVLIMGERLSDRRSLVVMATLGCIFSVIAAPLITNVLPVAQSEQTFRLLGQVLDGVAQGMLWIAWGIALVRFDLGDIEAAFLSWMPVSALMILAGSALSASGYLGAVWLTCFLILLPIISTAAFYATIRISEHLEYVEAVGAPSIASNQSNRTSSRQFFVGDFIHLGCAFVVVSVGWKAFLARNPFDFEMTAMLFGFGAATTFMVIWFALKTTPRFGLSTIYRWTMPIFTLGVALDQISGQACSVVACVCFTVVNMTFEMMAKLFTVYAAKRMTMHSAQMVSLGFAIAALGGLSGMGIWAIATTIGGDGAFGPVLLLTMCGFAFLASAVFERDISSQEGSQVLCGPRFAVRCENDAEANYIPRILDSKNGREPEPTNDFMNRCRAVSSEYGLSDREFDVLYLLGQGRSRTYIREALYISKGTVDTHIHHIYSKMGINSKDELMKLVLDCERPH